ncbi:ribosome-binding protein [Coemansia sp. RSA 2711]|nr:ribosome-binding protein [Coemansia sp. RSA 2711]KAJ2311138.1 ribosome-binding protein [Coemansia sp. RSA 2705]KAJ2318655.1 ribosome-binding protein [Coemansia sp. RSA 2704]KAJ2370172.1 ribosome-binding protein [Coemansia sp. RSA 2610]KAJ2392162.1 ribosome-binding protein [Coemansia sp. RSA 2611]KAJ2734988.1 ribosome-binding protein [Coemansia sp. Cherry 401B]
MEYVPEARQQLILCCECGTAIPPNPANMCVNCVRSIVDITEGIPKQATIHWCKNCERYLQPPATWMTCDLESRELLSLCLKKLRGLTKVRLIDAGFIWTEPHSRRVKVKLTIQKEVFAATILQQAFEVEYVVSSMMCPDCTRVMAQNTWKAKVQVRQKVDHQRTFFYLEQLILKHNAHQETINIVEAKGGLDFHFAQRSHAIKMVEFLGSMVPTRSKTSEQLISSDEHTGTANYKFTYAVELIPICKDDLVVMPKKTANALGQIAPLVLCTRVGSSVHIIDFKTLQIGEISGLTYWRSEDITPISSKRDLKKFYVVDVELVGPRFGKYALADVTVQRMADVGKNDNVIIVRSHLGNILNFGDLVLGYDLLTANINNPVYDRLDPDSVPSIVLVRKGYAERRRKRKQRNWRLQSLNKDEGDLAPKKQDEERKVADFEAFLRDLEEDPELRQGINMYRDHNVVTRSADAMADDDDDEEGDDAPEVPLEELLNNLAIGDSTDVDDDMAVE